MKVFSISQRVNAGRPMVQSVNCQLSIDEIVIIKRALEKLPPVKDNLVLESARAALVDSVSDSLFSV